MADKNGFLLRIITPDRVFYENQVDMVEFNTTEGEVGILPGHIPMTVIVKPGVLCIGEPEGEKLAALHAGFAEILPEGVTILAEVIEWRDRREPGGCRKGTCGGASSGQDSGHGHCKGGDRSAESHRAHSGAEVKKIKSHSQWRGCRYADRIFGSLGNI